jgi:hypothetical protein
MSDSLVIRLLDDAREGNVATGLDELHPKLQRGSGSIPGSPLIVWHRMVFAGMDVSVPRTNQPRNGRNRDRTQR